MSHFKRSVSFYCYRYIYAINHYLPLYLLAYYCFLKSLNRIYFQCHALMLSVIVNE